MSAWRFLCDCINRKHAIGFPRRTEITRKEIMEHSNSPGLKGRYNEHTIDCYRRLLERVGHLETVSRGKYAILNRIPDDLTVRDVFEELGYSKGNK